MVSHANLALNPRIEQHQSEDQLTFSRIRISSAKDICSLYPLIAAYIEHPELAESVVELAVDTEKWPGYEGFYGYCPDQNRAVRRRPVSDEVHEKMEDYVWGMGLADEVVDFMIGALRWKKREVRDGITGAEWQGANSEEYKFATTATAIVASFCSNVATLYLGHVDQGPWSICLLLASMGRLAQPALQKVARVELLAGFNAVDQRDYGLVNLERCFNLICRLPALESVVAVGVADWDHEWEALPARCSSMRKLEVTHADMQNRTFATILKLPKALEEFKFSLGGLTYPDGGMPSVSPNLVGQHLWLHMDTLRVLDLDIDACFSDVGELEPEEDHPEPWDKPGTMAYAAWKLEHEEPPRTSLDGPDGRDYGLTLGGFRDYAALRSLKIGVAALLGSTWQGRLREEPHFRMVDALPGGLEYLCVYGYRRGEHLDVDEHVDEFVRLKEERFPGLVVEGLEQRVDGELASWGGDEDTLWVRPERDFGWVRADD